MDENWNQDILICPRCGGQKQGKNHQKVACACTCIECSDCKEYE